MKKSNLKRKILKRYVAFGVAILMIMALTIPVYANPPDTSAFRSAVQTGLMTVITIVGGGFLLIGVVTFIQSQSSNDENQKTQGVKQIAVGIALIVIGNGLVLGFMSLW
jgi:uncharacterized membrane-anchored protein